MSIVVGGERSEDEVWDVSREGASNWWSVLSETTSDSKLDWRRRRVARNARISRSRCVQSDLLATHRWKEGALTELLLEIDSSIHALSSWHQGAQTNSP